MTDTTEVQPDPGSLIVGDLYKQPDGVLLIAESSTSLRPVFGGPSRHRTTGTYLYATQGTAQWANEIINALRVLVEKGQDLETRRARLETHLDNLGQALLEEAERRGWCEEYEEFAEKWDLPKRTREYIVTITVYVEAKESEEARRLAERCHTDYEYNVLVEELES